MKRVHKMDDIFTCFFFVVVSYSNLRTVGYCSRKIMRPLNTQKQLQLPEFDEYIDENC